MDEEFGKKIKEAREIRHRWHSDGMKDDEAIEKIDEILGTNFLKRCEELRKESLEEYIEIWRDEIIESSEDEEKIRDCENLTSKELLKKYKDEIEESFSNFEEVFYSTSVLEKLNEEIREKLNKMKYEYMEKYPQSEISKEWKEEKKEWVEWKNTRALSETTCECGSGLSFQDCCGLILE